MLGHAVVVLQSGIIQSSWSVEVDKLMWRVSSKMTWSFLILNGGIALFLKVALFVCSTVYMHVASSLVWHADFSLRTFLLLELCSNAFEIFLVHLSCVIILMGITTFSFIVFIGNGCLMG